MAGEHWASSWPLCASVATFAKNEDGSGLCFSKVRHGIVALKSNAVPSTQQPVKDWILWEHLWLRWGVGLIPTKSPLALFFCGRRTVGFLLSVSEGCLRLSLATKWAICLTTDGV